jgi:hypothetical protein
MVDAQGASSTCHGTTTWTVDGRNLWCSGKDWFALICFQFGGEGAGTCVLDPAHRNMPLLLPHELYPWMMHCGIWPSDASSSTRTQQYSQHLRDVKSPVAGMSPSGDHVPIYLWGDGAQYTESGQSIMVLACGLVMDDVRTNIFPLCLCREDPWMQSACRPM